MLAVCPEWASFNLMAEVTRILSAIQTGDNRAAQELLPLVYDELRRLAARKMAHEAPGQTLNATALVHEAYLRLVGEQHFESRGHFFAAAAEAMRRILVEKARRKKRIKHGGEVKRAEFDVALVSAPQNDDDILALDEALNKLRSDDPVKSRLVELRFFAGLSIEEAATILEISTATAKRYWRFARAWLHREVGGVHPPPE